MATDAPPTSASAAFPAPPPFYKSFTPANLALLQSLNANNSFHSTPPSFNSTTQSSSAFSPALQYLTPPPPPPSGTYRCFGATHTIPPPQTKISTSPPPTQVRLRTLTRSILLTFLSLTQTLASSPENYAPHWDKLRDLFLEAHGVVNEYRPHQARETLIEMMEEQIQRAREEAKGAKEMVRGVKAVLERIAAGEVGEDVGDGGMAVGGEVREDDGEEEEEEEGEEKMVWRVLEREVGFA